MNLEVIGGLDGVGEPDVDEDRVSTGENCDGHVGIVLTAFPALYVHASILNAHKGVFVIVIVGRRYPDLHPTIPHDLSHPPTLLMVSHSSVLLFSRAMG